MRHALVLLSLVGAAPLAAQGSPLIGTWKVTYPAGAKMENGVTTRINGTGVLTIEQVNDSLIGTLVRDPEPGAPARPNPRFAAKAGPEAEATFTGRGKVTLRRDDDEREATSVSTWKLKANGDLLAGTSEQRIEGIDLPTPGPQPVSGVRSR